jgi:hypothetical protein
MMQRISIAKLSIEIIYVAGEIVDKWLNLFQFFGCLPTIFDESLRPRSNFDRVSTVLKFCSRGNELVRQEYAYERWLHAVT